MRTAQSEKKPHKMIVKAYTDGSCIGRQPNVIGWASLIFINSAPKHQKFFYGSQPIGTNNAAELLAAIAVLEFVNKRDAIVTIVTDSKYIIHCFRSGKDWIKAKKPFPNCDLVTKLHSLITPNIRINCTWIKGHSGDKYHDTVDTWARRAANQQLTSKDYIEYKNYLDNLNKNVLTSDEEVLQDDKRYNNDESEITLP